MPELKMFNNISTNSTDPVPPFNTDSVPAHLYSFAIPSEFILILFCFISIKYRAKYSCCPNGYYGWGQENIRHALNMGRTLTIFSTRNAGQIRLVSDEENPNQPSVREPLLRDAVETQHAAPAERQRGCKCIIM